METLFSHCEMMGFSAVYIQKGTRDQDLAIRLAEI